MERNALEKFKSRQVQLRLKPSGFFLQGTIDAVYNNCFEFSTNQKTSLIDIDSVISVVLVKQEGDF